MAFCPLCCSEYRAGFSACAECQVDLVERLPDPPPVETWSEAFCGDSQRALAIRGALESAGIETLAPDDYAANLGWYAPASIGRIRVLVQERDLPEAKEITAGVHRLDLAPPGPSPPAEEGWSEPEPVAQGPDPETRPPPSEAAGPRPIETPRLLGRIFFDLLLATAFPMVAVAPLYGRFTEGQFLLAALLDGPCLLGMVLWRRRRMIEAKEPVVRIWGGSAPLQVFQGLLVGGLLVAAAEIYLGVLEGIGAPVDRSASTRAHDWLWNLFWGVECVVVAPLCEEAFFRGGVLGAFAASSRQGWGIFTSALLFAVLHFSPYKIPICFFDGIVLAYLFLGTRSLLAPIVAHATRNAAVLALALLR